MHRTISSAGLGLFLSMAVAAAAMAGEAVVKTVVCESFPEDAAIVLEPVDDSPLNLEIGEELAMALRHAGYRIADAAGLELRYKATEKALRAGFQDRSLGRLKIGGGEGVSLKLNIWSNRKDSILGGRQRRQPRLFETHLILTMQLDRHVNGACVWRGEAGASLVGWQHSELASRPTRALADAFGKDVRLQRVELR